MTAAAMAAVLMMSSSASTLAVLGQEGTSVSRSTRTASSSDAGKTSQSGQSGGSAGKDTGSSKATNSDAGKNESSGGGSGSSGNGGSSGSGGGSMRASASVAERAETISSEEDFDASWSLVTDGGTLVIDGSETSVEKLEGNKGTFTNEDGDVLEIDATSGKFALQAERTQVNRGTKLTVPVGGEACLVIIDAHKAWRGSDNSDSGKLVGAKKSLTVDAKSCTVESVETCTDDANYEIYTFLCVLEEGQTSLTMEVTIPEEFSTNNAYFRSLSIESTEAPVVEETYPVTLNFSDEPDLSGYNFTYSFTRADGEIRTFDSLEKIALEDGTWTLTLLEAEDRCPYEIAEGGEISVSGNAVTQKVAMEPITRWELNPNAADDAFNSTIQNDVKYYHGLKVDASNGGKLAANQGNGSSQFNAGTIISVPVTGPCMVTVTAHSASYALYTINGEPASADSDSTTISYDGEAGYMDIVSTGTAYIKSIALEYPPEEVEVNEQEVMPEVADFGSPDMLMVAAEGQTLRLTQLGGEMTGKNSIDDSVSYYLFPETTAWDSLTADVVLEEGKSSTSSGVFVGAFDGTYLTTIGIRGLTGLRGIYSKKDTEYVGAGGTNTTVTAGETYTFHVQKTDDGLTISVTGKDGTDESYTYKYNSSSVLQFKDQGSATPVRYGFAVTSATAAIRNMVYQDADGNVLYDQNDCYKPKGEAPVAESITAAADASREFIHVTWTGEECDADGYYVLQVSRDGTNWEDVETNLKEMAYDYAISEAGDYYFRVCGALGNNSDEENRNTYVAMDTPVNVIAALPSPAVTIAEGTNSLKLTWNAVTDAVRYEVYRYSFDETEENKQLLAEVTETSYEDMAIEPDMPYYYSVVAYSADNYSNPSETVWSVACTDRTGEYAYEDEAVGLTITRKSYDTAYQEEIILEGIAEKACTLTAEVNGEQQGAIDLGARESFHLDLTLQEGRNDVTLYLQDASGAVSRYTYNYVYLTNYDMVVDASFTGADGTEENGVPVYRTVQAAINQVPEDNTDRCVILVKEGSYREHLTVDKPYVSLIGEDRNKTVIHFYDKEESPEGGDMAKRCAVYVTSAAEGFSAENLTFENDYVYTGAGGNESADALRNDAEYAMYVNLVLKGYQDTVCANKGMQYYYKCEIWGNVDFIYGNDPRALFEDCDLIFRYNGTKNSGYVAAPKTDADAEYGLLFNDCRILSQEGCSGSKYLLARPWGADGAVTFIDTYMGKIVNAAEPYSDMSGNAFMNARFFEYGTYGPGFAVNTSRRQISGTKAAAMLSEAGLGWNPQEEVLSLSTDGIYVGDIVTPGAPKYDVQVYDPDTYLETDGDDTGLGRFALEGYAKAGGVTGGGLLKETSDSYYQVDTAEEFLQALMEVKTKGSKAVIELTADIGLGCNEIENFDSYSSVIKPYGAQPLTHPELIRTGTSILMIQNMSNLTIFSQNGSRILHANVDFKNSENIIIRNLAFDELWEWDEDTAGDYDRNDWDYMTIESESTDIWIDHCTFYKAYDGVVDIKNPSETSTSNVTISWCEFLPGSRDEFFDVMMDELKSNPEKYPYYSHLLNDYGMTEEQIYSYAHGQKKTHLLGQSDDATNARNIRLTLANNHYKDSMDRMPRMRYGDAHVYNCILDASDLYTARNAIANPEAAAKIVSNGASSTCGGQVLLENCYIDGIVNALNSGNGSSPAGYINAVNSVYYLDGVQTVLEPKSNSTADDRVLILDADAFKSGLPYDEPVYYDAESLDEIIVPNAGAGRLDMTVLQWEKGTYYDDTWTGDGNEPETPVEPEEPSEPETPVGPEEPSEPETPVGPEEPSEPEIPVNPEEPSEPETPVNPEEPSEPETPVNPEEPSEPEIPQKPEWDEDSRGDSDYKIDRTVPSVIAAGGSAHTMITGSVPSTTQDGQWKQLPGGGWNLIKADGSTARNEWAYLNGRTWYLFDSEGKMVQGWANVNGTWYYMDAVNGDMKTGWQLVNGVWYYMDAVNGGMKTGWQFVGEKWYYLDPATGSMRTGRIQVDGVWYSLNPDGSWVG